MSQSSNLLKLISLNMTMRMTVCKWLHHHQNATLGCGGAGDSHHGCAVDKSAAAVTCCHVSSQHIIEFVLPLQLRKLWIKNGGPKRWNKLFILGKINNRKLYCFFRPAAKCLHYKDSVMQLLKSHFSHLSFFVFYIRNKDAFCQQ